MPPASVLPLEESPPKKVEFSRPDPAATGGGCSFARFCLVSASGTLFSVGGDFLGGASDELDPSRLISVDVVPLTVIVSSIGICLPEFLEAGW